MEKQRVGRYEVQRELGRGGMGEVYLCRDPELDRLLAVKLLHPEAAANPKAKTRFKREARSLAALNHPGIVTIYEIGQDGTQDFIAMEFVSGRTLRQCYAERELELSELLRRCSQVAPALAAAHNAGVLHRDIKPDNVMVTEDGGVKVVDFGLASRLQDETHQVGLPHGDLSHLEGLADVLTRTIPTPPSGGRAITAATDTIFGTPAYMAPEVLRGEEATPSSDVYSFGVLIYEAVTGALPFQGDSLIETLVRVMNPNDRPARADTVTRVPVSVADLLEQMLALRADNRPSMSEVARQLHAAELQVAGVPLPQHEAATVATAPLPVHGGDLTAPLGSAPLLQTEPLADSGGEAAPRTTGRLPPLSSEMAAVTPRAPRRLLLWGAAMLASVAVVMFAWLALRHGGDIGADTAATAVRPPPGSIRVAIPPFTASFESWANSSPGSDVIAHLLNTLLRRVPAFDVVSVQDLRDHIGLADVDDPAWERAARDLGAAFIVRGKVHEKAGTLYAEVDLIDLTTMGDRLLSVREEAPVSELDGLLARLATHVARALVPGTPLIPSGAKRSMGSLEQFELGTRALYEGEWPTAVVHLERAVAEQPEFFDAWYQLALARGWAATKPELTVEAATRAVELAETDRDRELMTAFRHYLKRENAPALEILRPLRTAHPRDRDVAYILGEALYHEGYHREGIELFRETLRIAPTFYIAAVHPLYYAAAVKDAALLEVSLSMVKGTHFDSEAPRVRLDFANGEYEKLLAADVGGWERIHILYAVGRKEEARAEVEKKLGPKAHEGRAEMVARLMANEEAEEARAVAEPVFETAFAAPGVPRHEFSLIWFGEVLVTTEMKPELERLLTYWSGRELAIPSDAHWRLSIHAAPLLGRPELARFDSLPYELQLASDAAVAEIEGRHDDAVALWRKVLDDPGQYGECLPWNALARNLHAAGHTKELREACREADRPAIYRSGFVGMRAACVKWGVLPAL